MTKSAKKPPKPVLWGACERCGRGDVPASELDHRFCEMCLPRPDVLHSLADQVARRHRLARHAADRPQAPAAVDPPIAPDAEHVWRRVPPWRTAHLFADGKLLSYCRQAGFDRPTAADLDLPAPETAKACRTCWSSYRSPRRRHTWP